MPSPTPTAIAAEATFDKTFTLSGAPTVTINTGSGYIHVNPGTDNQFHIIGHVHSNWPTSEADLQQIVATPPIEQSGNTITVGTRNTPEIYHNVAIDYDVTTPRSSTLTAHSGSGSVRIAGIPNVATAGTGSGSIHIDGVAGALHASTGSGSIEVAGNPTADWRVSTGSGSIHLVLPADARFNLSAETGSGSIHTDRPVSMQGSLNSHHVSGSVNGGGPNVHATTGSGSITIGAGSSTAQLEDNNSLHVHDATDCVDNPTQLPCRRD